MNGHFFTKQGKHPNQSTRAKKQDTAKLINSFQATWKTMNISSNKEDPPGSSGGKVAVTSKVSRRVLMTENWRQDGTERDT